MARPGTDFGSSLGAGYVNGRYRIDDSKWSGMRDAGALWFWEV
jgi:hypothetical protein